MSEHRTNIFGFAKRRDWTTINVSSGFVPKNEAIHTVYNRAIGFLALVFVLPLMLIIAAALFVTQGREIFYAGPRLGLHKKTFYIYKFRTLDSAKAQVVTAQTVLRDGENIETPLGKFLRASRLDELPQLFNILRGDMNIVGPRPVRAAIAAIELDRNPHYSVRFRVKPGLVGHTQAYMCHGTNKPIRAKYNYALCVSPVNYLGEVALVAGVGMAVVRRTVTLIGKKLFPSNPTVLAQSIARDWDLHILQDERLYKVLGFTGDGLSLADLTVQGKADLLITTRNGGIRRAQVHLTPSDALDASFSTHKFECTTDLSAHFVSRFLRDTAVVGPKPRRKKARMTREMTPAHPITPSLQSPAK